ncbi:MAG TPA: SAF domain-containing protein, partial [Symbiobacteriaceae bacterium]|nr:SAF domain-containing protein [Symbiobacteriaceae bacterium]
MDKGKLVRLILIPIIIGLVVTLIVRQVLTPAQATSGSGESVEMVGVVVVATKESIPAKTKLTEQHLVVKQVPRAVLIGSEFAAVNEVVGHTTEVVLLPGEIVLK